MKNLSESLKSKIINESSGDFTYDIQQNPIRMDIHLYTAMWYDSDGDDVDFLEEEKTRILDYGHFTIEGTAEVNKKKSNFEFKLIYHYDDSGVLMSDTSIRGSLPKEYYGNIIDALCSKNSVLYDVSESIEEYKDDIVDTWCGKTPEGRYRNRNHKYFY